VVQAVQFVALPVHVLQGAVQSRQEFALSYEPTGQVETHVKP